MLVLLGAILAAGCADPVVDAEIDALPEDGMRDGPMHRGGQPCTLCHSSYGGRSPSFSLAGTLYQKPTNKVPIEGADIHVIDASGATFDLTSNCAGNFYVSEAEWQPTFPLRINITDAATGMSIRMTSKVGRSSSCATCHGEPSGTDAVGHVWLTEDPAVPDMTPPPLTCGQRGGP